MKLPRKGILIRLAIYVPVISFLAWNAFGKSGCGKQEEPAPAVQTTPGKQRTMTMPDGSEVHYLELTEDEARQMGIDPDPSKGPAKAEQKAPAKAAD